MPAYVVVMMDVEDPDLLMEYALQTPPIVKKFGGRYLTRGATPTCLEGTSLNSRLVVSEWPSKEAAIAFFSDPKYVEIAKTRHKASKIQLVAVQEGVGDNDNPEPNVGG